MKVNHIQSAQNCISVRWCGAANKLVTGSCEWKQPISCILMYAFSQLLKICKKTITNNHNDIIFVYTVYLKFFRVLYISIVSFVKCQVNFPPSLSRKPTVADTFQLRKLCLDKTYDGGGGEVQAHAHVCVLAHTMCVFLWLHSKAQDINDF